jgi:predicted NACHT family NTPase
MPQNSLKACAVGIEKAKTSLTGKRLSNQKLAKELGVSRQPVDNFFKGKPVSNDIFITICEKLDLDWEEITGQKSTDSLGSPEEASVSTDIDALVQEVRKKVTPDIKERCGTMRVLDMTQSIGLCNIYTDVNIFEKITGRTRRKIAELLQNFDVEDFDRFGLGKVTQKRVPGLQAVEQHSKLMVLGKPGAGKTTFLKYLAMQCIEGEFQKERFPIFITLKEFAEAPEKPNLLKYITERLSECDLTDADVKAKQLLKQGKVLVLLDGLDEVREENTKSVLDQVQEFSYQFSTNQLIITCRIAAKEYTFQGFTEVEVADFDSEQIATFAQNWFQSKKDAVKGKRFIEKLEENKPIQELATNPLLLTLLCLVFGEAGDFPANRSELYTEGVDVLLKKWDVGRNIERDKVYKELSLQGKENLLSHIALTTFEQKNYFFKKKTVEDYIADFIRNLRNANTAPEALELDSEAILKSIEAQHGLLVARATGIYSFSHLTFHEYFAAREIKERSDWAKLAEHVAEKRWREVFLLTTGMVRSADDLLKLMKQKIDELLAGDEQLQYFLSWVNRKSNSVEVPYNLAAVRALYLGFSLPKSHDWTYEIARSLDTTNTLVPTRALAPEFALDRHLFRTLEKFFRLRFSASESICYIFTPQDNLPPTLESKLQQYIEALKSKRQQQQYIKGTINNDSEDWTEQLRTEIRLEMINYRDIGHDWQFTDAQEELLKQYYNANKLLVDCFNSDCYVSREVRQEIEDTLLLPNAI